jgi:uracil-DNA glycosylase family 4
MEKCTLCKLSENSKREVPGKGKINPEYMFVGEAPGEEEDRLGEPFIGGAGSVLNQILYASGIYRPSTWITNVCRCRPPGNRTPTQEEVQACFPKLKKEINIIRPKHIIALGDTASRALTGCGVSTYRGSILPLKDTYEYPCNVIITYHPAFVMRQWELLSTVVWDIKKLKMDFPIPIINYLINPVKEQIKAYLDYAITNDLPTSVDIETRGGDKEESEKGLNPFADEIIGIGFCHTPGWALNISGQHMWDNWDLVKWFLETHKKCIIQTVGTFDNTFLWKKGIKFYHYWNTATAMYCINSDSPRKLEYLRSLYTNMPPYKHVYKNPSILGTVDLGRYNCIDVDITLRVHNEQLKYTPIPLMQRMMKEEYVALSMRLKGIKIDKDNLIQHYGNLLPEIDSIEAEFNEIGVNIASNKQLSQFMYKELELTPSVRASKGKTFASVDEEEIVFQQRRLDKNDPKYKLLEKILTHREKSKIKSTYCEGVFKIIQEDGRVHPDWNPQGTDTGRWACKTPNIQNIPKPLRSMFIPSSGKVFIAFDYNRLELWVGAILAEEDKMLLMLRDGVDIHNIVHQEILKYDPNIERIKAKGVVFGGIYGRSKDSVAREFNVPVHTVGQWYDIFYSKFPKFISYMERNVSLWKEQGFLESPFGRRKYCRSYREALNFPIQSTASDVAVNGLIALYEEGFHPIMNIHDQIVCEEDEDKALILKPKMQELMEHSTPWLNDRFPVEGGIGYTWKEV